MTQYSPYHKTYRYLLYQNQAYHQRNKRNASPQVKTNIRHSMSRLSPVKNPENNFEAFRHRSTLSQSTNRTHINANNVFLKDNGIKNVIIDVPIKQIHMHKSHQKINKKQIYKSNMDLVRRMIESDCQVVKQLNNQICFQKHKKYQQIRTKFHQNGNRRDNLSLGNRSLLCPTLPEYMKSGLGQSFLHNLSMKTGKEKPCIQPSKRIGIVKQQINN